MSDVIALANDNRINPTGIAQDVECTSDHEEVKIPFQAHVQVIYKIYPQENILTPTEIYAAKYKQQDVILKKIMKNKLDQDGRLQAVEEQKLQDSLQHLNLVSGVGSYETEDAYCIVMELIDQADYFKIKLIENYKPIKKEIKIKMYVMDILEGLKYLHDQNIAHLDIKLENLFCQKIEQEGVEIRRVKLGDFGISKKVDPVTKKVFIKNQCGTRDYMAPEIKNETEISLACDIWSFGVTLYHMVTGYVPTKVAGFSYGPGEEIPFRKRDWKKIEKGDQLYAFICKCLQFKPEERPSVDDLLNDPFLKA